MGSVAVFHALHAFLSHLPLIFAFESSRLRCMNNFLKLIILGLICPTWIYNRERQFRCSGLYHEKNSKTRILKYADLIDADGWCQSLRNCDRFVPLAVMKVEPMKQPL